jgi:hypothetical protein
MDVLKFPVTACEEQLRLNPRQFPVSLIQP